MGRRIRPNGILSPPYPEVTLDNFGFPVGGRLATRRAVFQPPGQNLTIDKWFFDRKSFFLKLSLKLIEVLWKAMVIVKLSHFVGFFVHFYKLIRLPPGPLCPPPPSLKRELYLMADKIITESGRPLQNSQILRLP